jgi:hypothetical protein
MRSLGVVCFVVLFSTCAMQQMVPTRPLIPAHAALRTPPTPEAKAAATSCPFTGCGGTITGTWNFTESCSAPISMPDPGCPTSTGSVTPSYSGYITFNSSGTYIRSLSVTGPLTLHLPKACVDEACSSVATMLNNSGYYTGVTCTSDGSGGCNCSGQMAGSAQVDQGTWSTSGNNVTTTPYSGYGLPAETDGYCVSNNTIKIEINSTGSVLNGTLSTK